MKDSYKNESAFEQDFCEILRNFGWETLKMDGVRRGFPDRMLLSDDGLVIFVEFKNPNGSGKLSPAQEHWLEKLDSMDQMVAVVETIEQAEDILLRLLGADYVNFKMGSS